jgi:hypothetical protein
MLGTFWESVLAFKYLFVCAVAAALPLASAQEAHSTKWVNLRAGPACDSPLVRALGPGTPLAVQGCTAGGSAGATRLRRATRAAGSTLATLPTRSEFPGAGDQLRRGDWDSDRHLRDRQLLGPVLQEPAVVR